MSDAIKPNFSPLTDEDVRHNPRAARVSGGTGVGFASVMHGPGAMGMP